jgi:hypothetical protein
MQKRIAILAVVIFLLIVGGYIAFTSLGGNTPIEVSLVNRSPEPLSGIYYVGTPQNPELQSVFEKIEAEKSLRPGSFLHTIYEVEPAGKLDTMRVFVGLNQLLSGDDIQERIFPEKSYLLAKIKANKWVMPGPEKVKEKLWAFADSANLELSDFFIDKIVSENEVHVIAPIKNE